MKQTWCQYRLCTVERELDYVIAPNATLAPGMPDHADVWPCNDYISVDDPDRSVNNSDDSPAKCDYDLLSGNGAGKQSHQNQFLLLFSHIYIYIFMNNTENILSITNL